ncbi:MAG TPA: uracil-DNA glycosylase family protein [Bryobacteraceae bacterium]|nr:uracil-DNA glycosylase family protein [Bryobacteraceae bacterium]
MTAQSVLRSRTIQHESPAHADKDRRKREALRASYRPRRVKILFVGESPPASGRFFYSRNSGLYRALRDAFQRVDKSIVEENFLSIFQQTGCYLIDACGQPVDRMRPAARKLACIQGEAPLSRRIRALQPETIVTLVRSIAPNVERAALRASWTGALVTVPYPGRWVQHRKVFLRLLLPHLKTLFVSNSETTAS